MSDWDNLDKLVEANSVPIKKIAASKVASSLEEQNILFVKENSDNDVSVFGPYNDYNYNYIFISYSNEISAIPF